MPEYLSEEEVFGVNRQPQYLDPSEVFGVKPEAKRVDKGRSWAQVAGDTGIDAAKSVIGFGESAVGLADLATGNLAGRGLAAVGYDPARTQQALGDLYSDPRQQANRQVSEAKGFVDTTKALLQNPSVIMGSIVESAPMMLGGVGAVRAVAAKMLAGAGLVAGTAEAAAFLANPAVAAKLALVSGASEGALTAGNIQEQGRQAGRDYTNTAPAALAGGALTAAIGFGTSKIPGFRDAEVGMATAGMGGVQRQGLLAAGKEIAKGAFKEGVLEEMPQSAQEQVFTNLALGKPWAEGVPEAAAQGMVVGAAQGGGMNVYSAGRNAMGEAPAAPAVSVDPVVSPVDVSGFEPNQPLAPVNSAQAATNSIATKPGTTAAETALLTPVTLTALDRVNEIDGELAPVRQRLMELTPENGYGPMFDQERLDATAQAAVLEKERADLSKDWPKSVPGVSSSFTTEAGARVEAQYALMDAADLITSHDEGLRKNPLYPPELQPRERERAASEVQVAAINQKLDPARLGWSADAATGAPIVGGDGLVESGNARTIALKRVYQGGNGKGDDGKGSKAHAYREFLRDNAAQFGITSESIDAMDKPVLVRVRSTPVNRAEFARQANASTVAAMAPSEQAKSDANRIDSMVDLSPDENGDFSNAASRPFIMRFMARLPQTERAGMQDADGNLSTSGYARVRNAVLAKAYGDSPVLARMTESMDDNLRNVSRAFMLAAPKVAVMRAAIKAGSWFDADITPDLMAAAEELSRLKDDGGSVADALAQTDLMGEQRSPEARQLLQFLSDNMRRPRRMADFIGAYMDALDEAGDPNQGSLLGDTQAPSKQDLLKAAERATTNETPNPRTTTQEAAPRTGSQTGQKPGDAAGSGGSAEGNGADAGVATQGSAGQASQPVSTDWVEFAPDSGAMGIPRAKMPQVKADKRPALYDFLMAKGITHTRSFVKPGALKPTQAEYSPAKAENAKALDGQKAVVLASSDGYILDGHHRWVSRAALGEMVDVIKFNAPMGKLLEAVREFPGATTSSESAPTTAAPDASTPNDQPTARAEYVALAKEALGELAAIASKHTRMTLMPEDTPGLMPALVKLFSAAIKIAGSDMKTATKWVKAQLKSDPRLKSFWQLISNETYQKAALQAFENPVAPDQSEMFEKPVAGEDQSSLFGETSGTVERSPEASNTAAISEEKQPVAHVQQAQAAIETVAKPAKEQELAAQEPAAVTPVKPAKIEDIGEKIGGARKDTAGSTGPRLATAKEQDDRATWAKRFKISQIAGGFDMSVKGRDITGKWTISDTRQKDRYDQPKQMGGYFDSKEEAEAALPLAAVAQKHRVTSTAKGADGEYRYEIWRDISDRKRVKVVDKVFDTRTEAMEYMAKNAQAILETSTTFGEADLPKPESTSRVGMERRTGDVKGEDFQAAFGFRGVEFGNWNNQEERQEVMNAAYDGLLDLAEVLGVPPKAIGLNGDLALAFGARGQGLSSARAHYERSRAVMNLTKMNGAGALAHEWFHALDHYLGRQDGKASAEWKINPDGTRSFDVKGAEADMASGGFRMRNSGVREVLRDAYTKLVQSLFYKAEQYVDDTAKADKFVAAARGDLEKELAALRKDLSEQKDVRYYKRSNKPASAEQLAEFDALAAEFVEGRGLATEWKSFPGKTRMSIQSRHTNDALEKMSEIYKAVRGRSGFDATNRNGVIDTLRQYITRYEQRLKLLADANSETSKTKNVPTNFLMDAKSMDQGRGTDYWTTPHEMVARAFQGYVEDMIAARGGKSPFLNYAPENSGVLTPWGVKRPYPSGDERKAMNAEFDNFVGAIQTKETNQGVAMFSSRESSPEKQLPLDQIERLVKSALRGVKNAPVIRVVASPEAIGLRTPDDVVPSGVTLASGDIYVFHTGIGSVLDVDKVVFHELFHKGLQNSMPSADYVAAMQEIAGADSKVQQYSSDWSDTNAAKAQLTELAKKYSGQALADQYEALATEEGLAMVAEDLKAKREMGTDPIRLRRLASWLADLADKLGMTRLADSIRALSYTEAEKFVVSTIAKAGGSGESATSATDSANSDIRMSRGVGGGMDVGVLESLAARIQARMPNMPKVNVLASPLDAPPALRDYIEQQGAMNDVDGAMHKGELYLFASGLPNALRAEHVLAEHEAAHFGLRAILGDSLKGVMQSIYNNNAMVRQAASELQRRGNLSNADATEEVIVDIPSSQLVKLQGWRKVVLQARDWLADHGFEAMAVKLSGWLDGKLSDQQRADLMVANLVRAARSYMAGKRVGSVKVNADTMLSGTEDLGGAAVLSRSAGAESTKKLSNADAVAEDETFSRSGVSSNPPPIDPKDASPLQKAKTKALGLTSPDALEKLIYDYQDKYIDLKRIRDHIKAIGGTITDLNDAYLGEELYHKRLAKRTEDFLSDEVQPLMADLRARGVGAEAFEQFLHARHAPEANKAMAARNPTQAEIDTGKASAGAVVKALEVQLQGAEARGAATVAIEKSLALAREEGYKWVGAQAFKGTEAERLSLSGMADAEAQAVMDGLSPVQMKNMNALAARVDAINAKTMDTLGQYGLMDQESLGEWRKAYQFYIPLHRDEAHPDSTSHPIGQGFSVKGDASKRRTGSNAKVTNILGHIAMQREAALTRGEKNTVIKKLYVMAAQNPDADLWTVEGVPKITQIDKKTGFAHSYPDPMYKNKPNVVVVRIAGKDAAIVFNERNPQGVRLAGAMKNLDVGDLGAILTQAARVTRYFAAINTQFNPVFGLINFARDIQAGMLNLSTTALAGQQAKVAKGVPTALRAVYRVERGKAPASAEGAKWAALWKDLQEVGGTTGYRDMYSDASDRMNALLKDLQKLERGQVSKAAHAVVDWLSNYNDAIENGVRLSAYSAALDHGMSRERAASLAKNLTVNFNRKGAKAREIGALYAFFNAAIQGNARMFETLRGPVGKKIMFGGVALGMVTSMIGMAVMGGGDGEDDEWEGIPEFVKERALVIPLGHQDYIAIPLPLGFHVFPNFGRLLAEWVMGGPDKSLGKQVGKVLGSLVDSFNPVGGGSDIGQVVMPTVMDPLLALWRNKDWTGRPIYRDDSNSMDPTPGFTRAKDSASTPGKLFAEAINKVTGGNEYRPGAWSPTPDQFDYVVGQVTGGLGRELLKVNQVITTPFTGDELPAHKIPVLGRIYGNTRGSGAQSGAFYENVRALNEVENEVQGRNKNDDDADAYMASEPLTNLIGDGNSQEKIVSNLRKQRKEEMRDEEPGYKDRVKEINIQIEEEMRVLNRAVSRVKSGVVME